MPIDPPPLNDYVNQWLMLKAELSKLGYDFEKVRIEVGTSFEAVGEALSSGK